MYPFNFKRCEKKKNEIKESLEFVLDNIYIYIYIYILSIYLLIYLFLGKINSFDFSPHKFYED